MSFLDKLFNYQSKNALDAENAVNPVEPESAEEESLRKKTMNEYKKFKAIKEIAVFEKEIKNLVQFHLAQTDYKEHKSLLREIESLIYYIMEVLKDDYIIGGKFFQGHDRMTKLDDYVFSQYGKEDKLSANITKIKVLAFSNRFDENPRQNLLSYFVFLEETGLEVIVLLNDFYSILNQSQIKSRWSFNYKSIFKFNKDLYQKTDGESSFLDGSSASATKMLMTRMTKERDMSPRSVQKELLQDKLRRESESKEEKS